MVPARFAVATHILLLLAGVARDGTAQPALATLATSTWLAARVHTNPVVVRRICGQMARAGLLRVRRGAGGATLARPAVAITLEDVWQAVDPGAQRPLLTLHGRVGPHADADRTQTVLAGAFSEAEAAFRSGLRRITLDQLAQRLAGG